jgi:hypothetical protein
MSGDQNHKPHVTGWILALLLVPLLYLLSYGPMLYFGIKYDFSFLMVPAFQAFYAPYAWLRGHTPLQAPLDAYGMWWVDLAGGLTIE